MYFCSNSLCGKEIFCGVGWGPESLSYYCNRSKKNSVRGYRKDNPKRIHPSTHIVYLSVIQVMNSSEPLNLLWSSENKSFSISDMHVDLLDILMKTEPDCSICINYIN